MNSIEICGLTKRFGSMTAVDHLDLRVKEGECLALLGMNGAGKTTVIRMLSCQLCPTEGDALILGNSIRETPARVKELVALSPQETAVAPNLTVRENLELIAGICGAGKKESAEQTEELLQRLSLQEAEKKRAGKLSGGWQRRLSIAMALIQQPKVLFLDEPTLGLDVLAKRQMIEFLKKINREKQVTILVTSHDMDDLTEMANRILLLSSGSLAFDGSYNQLVQMAGDNRIIKLTVPGDAPALAGASYIGKEEGRHLYRYDASAVTAQQIFGAISRVPHVQDVELGHEAVEQVIARLYQNML